jgi:hypothetical protein
MTQINEWAGCARDLSSDLLAIYIQMEQAIEARDRGSYLVV